MDQNLEILLMFFLFQSQFLTGPDKNNTFDSTSNYLCTKRLEIVLPVYLVLSPIIVAGIQFR